MRCLLNPKFVLVLTCLCSTFLASEAFGGIVVYHSRTDFDAALPGGWATSTIDFDSIASGTLLPSGNVIPGSMVQLNYSIPGITLQVASEFDTTSPSNYLGTDEAGNLNQFVAGDTWSLAFGSGQNAFGMYFITSDTLLAGDIELVTSEGSLFNSDTPQSILGDGGRVYFIGGITDGASISGVDIGFDPGAAGAFLYNVDDITVASAPEPASGALLVAVVSGVGYCIRRRFRKVSPNPAQSL